MCENMSVGGCGLVDGVVCWVLRVWRGFSTARCVCREGGSSRPVNQSINQSIKQSINGLVSPAGQSVSQSVNQTINQISQSIDRPTEQSISHARMRAHFPLSPPKKSPNQPPTHPLFHSLCSRDVSSSISPISSMWPIAAPTTPAVDGAATVCSCAPRWRFPSTVGAAKRRRRERERRRAAWAPLAAGCMLDGMEGMDGGPASLLACPRLPPFTLLGKVGRSPFRREQAKVPPFLCVSVCVCVCVYVCVLKRGSVWSDVCEWRMHPSSTAASVSSIDRSINRSIG
jgi:hypothetical protein